MTFNGSRTRPLDHQDGIASENLYIIESSCGWIKIGRTVNVKSRFKSLECQSPPSIRLTLIAVVEGFGPYESTLHEAFSDFRGRGEWFSSKIGPALREAISGGIEEFILALAQQQITPAYCGRSRNFAAIQKRLLAVETSRLEQESADRIAESIMNAELARMAKRSDEFWINGRSKAGRR